MDQLGFCTQPGASSQTNRIVGRLIDLETNLIRVTQTLAEVNRKVNLLLGQCIANHADYHVASAHTATLNGAKSSLVPTPHQILTQNGSESDYNFGMSGEAFYPLLPDSVSGLAPSNDMLPPPTAPASMVYRDGVWADPPSPTSRVLPNPSLPVRYLFTGEGTDIPAQVAESSTSPAAAKPHNIEDNIQSESSSLIASSSSGGYNRARNAEERTRHFEQICEVLSIPWMGDELPALQNIIRSLRGNIPDIGGGKDRKGKAIRACFNELQRIVGPHTNSIAYNKVLNNVLARVTAPADGPSLGDGDPCKVLRLDNW